jgi:catechol 2,3-dioxygenase
VNNFHQSPLTFIRSITLNVNNRQKMVEFYTWLGMRVLRQNEKETTLGTANPLLILKHDQPYPIETKTTQGLYHVAYLVPTREELGSILNHLIQSRYPLQGLSDHGVSEAIYLSDPEGNGIEIYADRLPILWPYEGKKIKMVTDKMNHQAVLALAKPFVNFLPTTIIGHLHLHVANLKEASKYYQDNFRFQLVQEYGNNAAFLSTGGYHHHLGLNTWIGENIPKKNPVTSGIIGYEVSILKEKILIDVAGLVVKASA